MKNHRSLLKAMCIISIGLSFLAGCSSSSDPAPPVYRDEAILSGWVAAGNSISGVRLSVYNTTGDIVYQSDGPATGEFGSFMMAVKKLPVNFRIVAENGILDGKPFPTALMADFSNFDPEHTQININIPTTLVSRYLDKHPGKTLEEASTFVRNLLGIPAQVDIGQDLNKSGGYFNYGVFFSEAEKNGGVGRYMDQLLEMTGPIATFQVEGSENGQTQVIGFIARNLAAGAVSYVGGKLLGWGLGEMGIGFPGESDQAVKQMQEQMQAISGQLETLNKKFDAMLEKLDAVSRQTLESHYGIRVGQMGNLISSILSIRKDLTHFESNPPTAAETLKLQRERLITRIERNIIDFQYVFHNQLVGTGGSGQAPLLKVWSQTVKAQHRFLSSRDSEFIQTQFEYFTKLQEYMLLLIVEYYHAIGYGGRDTKLIDDAINQHNKNIEDQEKLIKASIPEQALIDTVQNLMMYEGDYFEMVIEGKKVKTKAPPYLWVQSEDYAFATMNVPYWDKPAWLNKSLSYPVFGFTNWRAMEKQEVEGLFSGRGGMIPRQYLSSQGWVDPLPRGMYFASKYYPSNMAIRYVYEVDNGTVHKLDYRGTYGGGDGVYWHWIPVRKMEVTELGNYFW